MSKPLIAVDMDDVLSATAEGFIAYSNNRYNLNLTLDDYTEHWMELWRVDIKETERRAAEFHGSGAVDDYANKDYARATLESLRDRYRLIIITSRNSKLIEATHQWVDRHFPGVFEDIKFAGIFDGPLTEAMLHKTKADLFASNKVDYVIDDQLKHCLAASELGIHTILYGDYPWNQAEALPKHVTRCADWRAVSEYFDARS